MEGGHLPWRVNKGKRDITPDINSYGKPLPPPPIGYYWFKREDKTWELKQTKSDLLNLKGNNENQSSAIEGLVVLEKPVDKKTPSKVLEHTIMPSDTLQGISLHYNVSAVNLRRINNFSGNRIQYMKTLKIPIESFDSVPIQADTPEVLIQKLKNMTNEGTLESKVYLEGNDWDLQKAYSQWKADINWESSLESKVILNSKELPCNEKEEIENDIEVVPAKVYVVTNEYAPVCVQLEPPSQFNSEQDAVLVPLLG